MNNIDSINDCSIHSSEEGQICYKRMAEKGLNYQPLFEVFSPNETGTRSILQSIVAMNYHIQSVTGGTGQTSGECSLGHTIPI